MSHRLPAAACALLLLAGCAATPPAPPLAAAPPPPLPAPPQALTLNDLLRGGGPDAARHSHDAQRIFPATTATTPDALKHETAKFFFQSLVEAARSNLPPGRDFETLGTFVPRSGVCTIRFDGPSGSEGRPRPSDFPRIVALTYSVNPLNRMASIVIDRRDRRAGPLHRSRIVFAERDGFTETDAARYYGFPTIPKPLYGFGLPCRTPPPVQIDKGMFGDDGGGGGEM